MGIPVRADGKIAKNLNSSNPNVILVITDDQGYGDLGCRGKPIAH